MESLDSRERKASRDHMPQLLCLAEKKKEKNTHTHTQNDLLYSLEYITFVVNYKRKRLSALLGPLQSSRVEAHLLLTAPEMLLD